MLELDERNYVLEAENASLPVLIGLYAGEHPLAEGFASLAAGEGMGLKFCKLEPHRQPALAQRLRIHRGASVLLLQRGRVELRLQGAYDRNTLEQILRTEMPLSQ